MLRRKENADLLLHVSAENLGDVAHGLSRNDDTAIVVGAVQLHPADRDAVSVQGDQLQEAVLYLQKLAGHHLVAVVVRDGKDRLVDEITQGVFGDIDAVHLVNLRESGEVSAVASRYRKSGLAAADADGLAHHIEMNLLLRKLPHNGGKNSGVHGNHSLLLHRAGNDSLDAELHIVAEEPDVLSSGIDQDALENGHGRFGRNSLADNTDRIGKI